MLKIFKSKKAIPATPETLAHGLEKSRKGLTSRLAGILLGKKTIAKSTLEEIETLLITSDVGVKLTHAIIDNLSDKLSRQELKDGETVFVSLKNTLKNIILPFEQNLEINSSHKPFVILMVGVNGSGKTTTIGKLAKQLQNKGKSVMLAAGDTFRAAAVEQIKEWGERNNVAVVAQATGADCASVIFDAISSAKAKNIDVVIADTAGRLHTQEHLMEELKKVIRVIKKVEPTAPHEVMLVLDASLGQNALKQAEKFSSAVNVSGITLTKLDGTAKGGIVFAIANELKLPLRFIGVGEKIDDLRPFKVNEFIEALFE